MPNAYLALVLHVHLPYVRPSVPEALEERWLFEAVTECYLPILHGLQGLAAAATPYRLAVSFSPPVIDMLDEPAVRHRLTEQLARSQELAARETRRLAGDDTFGPLAAFYAARLDALATQWQALGGDVLSAFAALARSGQVELFTAAGAHNILPLLATAEGRRAAVEAACRRFAQRFGRRPQGIWLPECGYAPGVDHVLAASGIEWTVAESITVAGARPPAPGAPYVPVLTPGGVAAFGRDADLAEQVWSTSIGYPGDPVYREFYRDIGFDLPLDYVAPFLIEGRVRHDTGFKYYRVTGGGDLGTRLPYDPTAAAHRAREHARHFAAEAARRAAAAAPGMPGTPLLTAPFDAELFGHWWFEGPDWLAHTLAALPAAGVEAVTPGEWLRRFGAAPVAQLPAGTWGAGGGFGTWVSPANDWIHPDLERAEHTLVELVSRHPNAPAGVAAALDQAGRELLMAQCSDWPFQIDQGTAVDYGRRRVGEHLAAFATLADAVRSGREAAAVAAALARAHPFFPDLDHRLWARRRAVRRPGEALGVLMLSWEYPPGNVGGLGTHVQGLAHALARQGCQVRVLTLADSLRDPGIAAEAPGVVVQRLPRPPLDGDFLGWAYRANLALAAAGREAAQTLHVHLVHAHDWLAGQAGQGLSLSLGVPLVATIHATEHGRNGGIRDALQAAIHDEEHTLAAAAARVITVSRAMGQEVSGLFKVEATPIANGVTPPQPLSEAERGRWRSRYAPGGAPLVTYTGRLVGEKGVHVAIKALARLSGVHLVCMGSGPARDDLAALAGRLGVAERVHFTGWVSDAERDGLLQAADCGIVPSLYEPFGIVALEVMAAGVPVVCSAVGGLVDIVSDGVDGLLVPTGDAEALAGALSKILTDKPLAARIRQAGNAKALGEFSWDGIATQTLRVYDAALGE